MTRKSIFLYDSPAKPKRSFASLFTVQPKSIAQIDEVQSSIISKTDSTINYFNGLIQVVRDQILEIKTDHSELQREQSHLKLKSNTFETRLNDLEATMETKIDVIEKVLRVFNKKLNKLTNDMNELRTVSHVKKQSKRLQSTSRRSLINQPQTQTIAPSGRQDDDTILFLLQ